jgi:hypothetical protein
MRPSFPLAHYSLSIVPGGLGAPDRTLVEKTRLICIGPTEMLSLIMFPPLPTDRKAFEGNSYGF